MIRDRGEKQKLKPLNSNPRPFGARQKGYKKAPVRNGYLRSFDGTKIFYSLEGQGKPLVFCYGLVCSSLHWTYQIDYFQNNYQTIWFDYRGHQHSEVPKKLKSITIENIARDLECLLMELQIPKACFIGHSMGVNVILELYRLKPQLVSGMILANGTPEPPFQTLFHGNGFQPILNIFRKFHLQAPRFINKLWKMQKNNWFTTEIAAMCGFNAKLSAKHDIMNYVNQVAETRPAVLIQLLDDYEKYNATAWLNNIKAPALILAGENDKIIPLPQQELMAQLIPKSELEIIHHGSHCPQMDLPDLVNLRIEKFLSQINYFSTTIGTKEISNPPKSRLRDPDQEVNA